MIQLTEVIKDNEKFLYEPTLVNPYDITLVRSVEVTPSTPIVGKSSAKPVRFSSVNFKNGQQLVAKESLAEIKKLID